MNQFKNVTLVVAPGVTVSTNVKVNVSVEREADRLHRRLGRQILKGSK